jgi:hypothetical protein
MDRLSDQLGLTTISPTIMQTAVEQFRRARTPSNEVGAAVDAVEPDEHADQLETPVASLHGVQPEPAVVGDAVPTNADDLAQLPSVATGGEP